MIQVYLSKDEYEYDIHSLVKAFYPNDQIKVHKEFPSDQNSKKDSINGNLLWDIKGQKDLYTSLVWDNVEIFIDFLDPFIEIKAIEKEVLLYSEKRSYANLQDKILIDYNRKAGPGSNKVKRNHLKRMLYCCLSHITGRELPWGTLTGVRPTKIAYEKLEEHIPEEEIIDYLKKEYLCSEEKTALSLQVAKREITLLNEMDYRKGYSIYIGIPFCPSTCLYCSFTSYSLEKYESEVESYLDALYKEITYAGSCNIDKKLTTVYLGGGTPTTLTARQLDGLLTHIKKNFDFTSVLEYTVEAGRPDSITSEKLKVLKDHGVTRISINPQTMNQRTLDLIGRKHSVKQVIEAFHMARDYGHTNINMDIIIGLPGEKSEDVAFTLEEMDKLTPDSLTVHTLAIKRAARLNIQKEEYQDMVSADTTNMLKLTSDYTKQAGYLPYYLYRQKNMADNLENIGYSKFGKEGLYNILIMEEKQTILALGAGALSKFVFHKENRIERVENVKSLKDYVERVDEMIERKRIFLKENSCFI
ncbi:coproporphyrinogen dehydrogenase HemZ [Anaerocolumna sedimenticola]|uniref:Coproporphyrinogen dehydrogenase HemZ n=1 Tax=Anaerocolumna sedimenticola TaxID=2696063 RepID=A0A6P1TJ22_9FIRM|nr:coproporphyrinogen dehydrogenase HemZ [Anaerocolumna sedimenticola]QHQ61200.1 coproporphyrinogen dehydrogenase HemZ [Anaerocolumna sedimenticola]